MSEYQNWLLDQHDRIATLTINRPDQMNSLTPETFRELRDVTARLRANRDVWAVIVQAEGDHFSVGVDVAMIGTMVGQAEGPYRETLLDLQQCLDAFEALEKPTIARLHGFCLGGGLILALCCDFRIASQRTVFGFPEVKRGVAVIMGTQRVTRVAGVAAAKEMILLADFFDADTAQTYGLVHKVVPPDELDSAVVALADKFRRLPPRTVGIAKRIINVGHDLSLRASQDLEIDAQAELLGSPDFEEAVRSFFEKRSPRFTGE